MISIRLPLPPNGNHRNGYNRNTATWYPTDATKNYRRLVQHTCAKVEPIDKGGVAVLVHVHRGLDKNGKLQRGDLDGYLKTLLDHLQGFAYRNDSQIRKLEAELFDSPDDPHVDIFVDEYKRAVVSPFETCSAETLSLWAKPNPSPPRRQRASLKPVPAYSRAKKEGA